MKIEDLSSRLFAECLHSTFTLMTPDGAWTIELVAVSDKPASGGYEQFSVMFSEAGGRHVPQGIYALEHERLGRIDLFLVPVLSAKGEVMLEAVFNRPQQAPELRS